MSTTTEKPTLTDRQLKAIPHLVSSPTYVEGCKEAGINKTTLYTWLKDDDFKAELGWQRDEIAAEAFGQLSQALSKAVETLAGLLDSKDDRLKRLAAKDIISVFVKHKETEDFDKRLTAIEDRIAEKR